MKYQIIPERCPIVFTPPLINENEIFVPINEYYYTTIKPFYLISSFGRVFNKYTGKFLTSHVGGDPKNSRYIVNLQFTDVNGKSKERRIPIHRAMMISFYYRYDCDNLEVDHVDGVWYHNYLGNLEWVTKEENIRRGIELNKIRSQERRM